MFRTSTALPLTVALGAWLGICGMIEPAAAETERVVSLDLLVSTARQKHPALAKSPLLSDSLALRRKQMNQAYWPQLSLEAKATWQSEVTSVDIPIPGAAISPPAKDQYTATLNLRQSLWDGGMVSDQKHVAEKRIGVEQEKVNVEWYQIHDKILQLYFAGIVQQELRAQAEQLESRLDPILENVRLALSNGIATERDVLLVRAKQLEARQALADSDAQLLSIRKSLKTLTGVSLTPQSRFAPPSSACAGGDGHHPSTAVSRPELSLLSAQGALLDAEEELERAGDRPKLGLFATGGYGRPGLNFLNDEFSSYFIGGVQLTIPLTYLYSGRHQQATRQLSVQRSLIARQQDVVRKGVQLQLDAQQVELGRLDAAILLDEELLRLRESARKQTELQLSLGTATMTDLVNDLSEEDRARTRGAVHRAQRSLACHQLAFIKGEL